MRAFTLDEARARCAADWHASLTTTFGPRARMTVKDIAEVADVPVLDRLATLVILLPPREQRLFTCLCARVLCADAGVNSPESDVAIAVAERLAHETTVSNTEVSSAWAAVNRAWGRSWDAEKAAQRAVAVQVTARARRAAAQAVQLAREASASLYLTRDLVFDTARPQVAALHAINIVPDRGWAIRQLLHFHATVAAEANKATCQGPEL